MLLVGAVVLIAFAVAYRWRVIRSRRSRVPPAGVVSVELVNKKRQEVHVPRVTEPLKLDGELTEDSWHHAPVTKFLQADGTQSRPYNDVRFLWSSDGILHVGLYASDLNIVTAGAGPDGPVWLGDAFHVVFLPPPEKPGVERSFWVGPTAQGAVLAEGEPGADGGWSYVSQSASRAAIDMDEGTVDNNQDRDEEWVVELDIPLASLGLKPEAGQRIDMVATRCDVDKRGGPPLENPCPETNRLALVFDP